MKLTRKNINFLHHGHITRKYSYRLTSHLGDSGMKKSPTSRTAQGTNPTTTKERHERSAPIM